jgi:hypothetical protein
LGCSDSFHLKVFECANVIFIFALVVTASWTFMFDEKEW